MSHTGRYPVPPGPGRTGPGEQVTPGSVVAMVELRLDDAGTAETTTTVTPETWDAAEHGARLLLAALGAATPDAEEPPVSNPDARDGWAMTGPGRRGLRGRRRPARGRVRGIGLRVADPGCPLTPSRLGDARQWHCP